MGEAAKALMTQTEYAAHRGVGKPAVSNWKRKGHLVWSDDPEQPGKKLIDVVKTDAVLGAVVDPTRGRPAAGSGAAPSGGGLTVDSVRLDLVRAQTVKHQLANAKTAGELVAVVEAETMAAQFARLARERMHGIVRQQVERLAAERDPRTITAFMTDEIDAAFDALADTAAAQAEELAAEAEPIVEADAEDEDAAA